MSEEQKRRVNMGTRGECPKIAMTHAHDDAIYLTNARHSSNVCCLPAEQRDSSGK